MATSRLTWACLYPLVESAQTFYDLRGGALDWPTLFQLVDWVDSVRSDQLYIEGTTDGTDFVLGIEGGIEVRQEQTLGARSPDGTPTATRRIPGPGTLNLRLVPKTFRG